MDKQRIYYLLDQELKENLSADESVELDQLKSQEENEELVQAIARMIERESKQPLEIDQSLEEATFKKIMSVDAIAHEEIKSIPQRSVVRLMKTKWFKYAAAIIILAGAGAYLWNTQQKEKPVVVEANSHPVNNDVAPGGNKASLTLADGSTINLDSVANGKIAQQDNTTITKSGDQIRYSSPVSRLPSPVSYNTMSTPRGGQYQLTLPDGTQVWLNAESSITYPTAFTDKERRVSITGEAYFEVAKDKMKKFIVAVASPVSRLPSDVSRLPSPDEKQGLQIEVLGTHFNVNAYPEEPTISTTLMEGSVRLTSHGSRLTTDDSRLTTHDPLTTDDSRLTKSLTLRPGQQGQLTEKQLSLAAHPNIEQVIAWKNGAFNFQGLELSAALRQIARWYDVEIVYTSKVPRITLGGGIGRDLKLSQVLKMLEGLGIKTQIENKKLYISE